MSHKRINAVFGHGTIGAILAILCFVFMPITFTGKPSPTNLWLYAVVVIAYILNSLAPLKWRRQWGYMDYRDNIEAQSHPYAQTVAFAWLMIYIGLAPGLFIVWIRDLIIRPHSKQKREQQ